MGNAVNLQAVKYGSNSEQAAVGLDACNRPPRHGVFLSGIDHDPNLPDQDGETVAITGGAWLIRVPFRTIRGAVLGGTLTSSGDETFSVQLLLVTSPGGAALSFTGTLRHDVFPPTIEGTIE